MGGWVGGWVEEMDWEEVGGAGGLNELRCMYGLGGWVNEKVGGWVGGWVDLTSCSSLCLAAGPGLDVLNLVGDRSAEVGGQFACMFLGGWVGGRAF